MIRTHDQIELDTLANWTLYNPVVAANVVALCTDTGGMKIGDGETAWADLEYTTGHYIGTKEVQSDRDPTSNEGLIFCGVHDKWTYRLVGCIDTETAWQNNLATVYPTFTMLIEKTSGGDLTGRIKISDGVTVCASIPWTGLNTSSWPTGYSLEFNGTAFEAASYLSPSELQSATTPTGKFHRDDGTWAEMTVLEHLDSIESDYAAFGTIYVGGFPTESTTVTLTSDGTSVYIDGQKVWTQYNDGAGSGLDADTLDGYHYTDFATGPASVTSGHIVTFGASPNILVDSGHTTTEFATGPASVTSGNFAGFGSSPNILIDSTYKPSDFAVSSHMHAGVYVHYHGSWSAAPATYSIGDEYWNTTATVLMKFISYDVGWKTITTT